MDILLFTSEACHLCEEVKVHLSSLSIHYYPIDIRSNIELKKRYGFSIPVLAKVNHTFWEMEPPINYNSERSMNELNMPDLAKHLDREIINQLYYPFNLTELKYWLSLNEEESREINMKEDN